MCTSVLGPKWLRTEVTKDRSGCRPTVHSSHVTPEITSQGLPVNQFRHDTSHSNHGGLQPWLVGSPNTSQNVVSAASVQTAYQRDHYRLWFSSGSCLYQHSSRSHTVLRWWNLFQWSQTGDCLNSVLSALNYRIEFPTFITLFVTANRQLFTFRQAMF